LTSGSGGADALTSILTSDFFSTSVGAPIKTSPILGILA
jgi:hypothetical protein